MRRIVIIALLVLIFINAFLLVKLTGEEPFDTIPPLEEDAYMDCSIQLRRKR